MAFDYLAEGTGTVPVDGVSIAVVIPSFRASRTVGEVLSAIGPPISSIYLIDDACPEGTGERALRECDDRRLVVLRNERNLGVGGAMKRGYRQAIADGADIVVKLDADGQMDPANISHLVAPILAGRADYSKGNRFAPASAMPPGSGDRPLAAMPVTRWLANRSLSLIYRLATGCSQVSDPANGYTAIHSRTLKHIDVDALADCFFFETDMLFQLDLAGAVVADVPLPARYPNDLSNVSLPRVAPRFARLIAKRWLHRLRSRRRDDRLAPIRLEALWCRIPRA